MAKVSLNKLLTKKDISSIPIEINDQIIEVKQYLPVDEKSIIIQNVLNEAVDELGSFSPVRLKIYLELEILKNYTNINFTEKSLEDISKLYDKLYINDIIDKVIAAMNETELNFLRTNLYQCADSIIVFNQSARGLMQNILADYKETKMDVDEITREIGDPEQFKLVKDILTKLG